MNAALDGEPRSAPRALVVEDSEHTAYLLAFMLERAGYAVTTAPNGRDAERVLSGEDPVDVVLLDLVLPHVSGFELLMQMRENPRRRSTPVVVLSGKGLEADVVRAFDLGADDFVSKPFRPQELMARIRRLTDASRRAAPVP
ncbi:MAG TPA: response regulator [Gammaproteobacteria bacterium]|nr:response regulator [Gammaproteobacteria bacterium]